MSLNEFSILDDYGVNIHVCEWKPDYKCKAAIILVHGLGEHIGRYEHVADFFTKNSYGVVGADLCGHGKSGGKKAHIPEVDTYLKMIDTLIVTTRELYPSLPIFLYGHSMGGAIVLWYSINRKPKLNGVISTSPWLAVYEPVSSNKVILAQIMNKIFPSFSIDSGLKTKWLSRDKAIVETYDSDPLVIKTISARLGWTILEKGKWLIDHANEFPLPLLLMAGSGEHIVSGSQIAEFAKKVPDVDYKVWDNLYHELHNEPEKEKVFKYELGWLEKHLK